MTKLVSVRPNEMSGARLGILIAFSTTLFCAVVWLTWAMFQSHPYIMVIAFVALFALGTFFYMETEYNVPLYRGKP